MGVLDRSIRIIIAVVLFLLFFTNVIGSLLGILLLVVASIFLLTSFVSFCPLYSLLGIKTSKTQVKE